MLELDGSLGTNLTMPDTFRMSNLVQNITFYFLPNGPMKALKGVVCATCVWGEAKNQMDCGQVDLSLTRHGVPYLARARAEGWVNAKVSIEPYVVST